MKPVRVLTMTAVAAAAFLASALATPAEATISSDTTARVTTDAIDSQCVLVSFDSASLVPDSATKRITLVVTGTSVSSNVKIELRPSIYIQQPDYWTIKVFGCTSGIGLPVLTSYTAKLDVTGTVGKIGVEVLGTNGSLLLPLTPVKSTSTG
jgi:hypothetical protein